MRQPGKPSTPASAARAFSRHWLRFSFRTDATNGSLRLRGKELEDEELKELVGKKLREDKKKKRKEGKEGASGETKE